MAELSATVVGERTPQGSLVDEVFRVTTGAAAADEWFVVGTEAVAVVGIVVVGAAVSATLPSVQLNAQGTGESEGSTPGAVGITNTLAGTFDVTVRHKV